MKKLLLVLAFISIISCNNSRKQPSNEQIETGHYFDSKHKAELKERCLEYGNRSAFGDLVDYYNNTPSEYYELLPIAIIMVDNWGCDNARVAIYFWFLEMQKKGRDEKQFFELDKSKQDFVLKYLIDGAKNKNPGCLGILHRLLESGLKMEIEKEKEIEELYKKTTANRSL